MEVLGWYFLFAASVGLWACYEFMRPALYEISITDPKDVLVNNRIIAYVTMFSIAALAAPLIVWLILDPKLHESVLDTLVNKRD